MAPPHEEGWYTDPYERHDARWFSDGTPTKLVLDGVTESYDEPPDEPPSASPERIEGTPAEHGEDLYRADDEETEHVPLGTRIAEQAEFGVSGGAHAAMPDEQQR